MSLEKIVNYGKKVLLIGATSTLIGLTAYCGGGSGGGGSSGGGTPIVYQCNDGNDNDSDSLIDYPNDSGCSSRTDNSELNASGNQAPTINSKSIQYASNETGQNIKYTVNVTDVDNNLNTVALEVSTDGVNFNSYTMTSTGSNNYERNIVFNDGAVVNARVRATDSGGLDSAQNYNILNVFLSEIDGVNEIASAIANSSVLISSQPNSVNTDVVENLNSLLVHFDKIVRFNNPTSGEVYRGNSCVNGSIVPIEFISMNNDLTINGVVSDPIGSGLDTLMNTLAQCPGTSNYAFGTVPDMSRLWIDYDNPKGSGTPTTKTDIDGLVQAILVAEDLMINYKPVADAGNILGVPKNAPFNIDATNSLDFDGIISLYELDLEGDGIYETSNLFGIFNILGGYPIDTCLYSIVRVSDDINVKDTAVDCIPVGSGVCLPCP